MRRVLFGLALAASWLVLLLCAARVDWTAPMQPHERRTLPGSGFTSVFGTGSPKGEALHVETEAEDFSSLQSVALPAVAARDFTTLRYRFADFPRTLELSLVFRTAEAADDVQTVALPWPGEGTSSFDLSHVEKWRGTIIELGFAEFAIGQVVPPERGFAPFDLVEAELWSPSWRGDLAALGTDWFGAWPWSQRSVHALGREGGAPRSLSIVVFVAAAIGFVPFWAALLLRARGRRLVGIGLACVVLGWLALDLRWQSGLVHRLLGARTLYAGVAWPERARIVGDSELVSAADEIGRLLRDEPADTRILLQADTHYLWLRLAWHLLPRNVAPLGLALQSGVPLPEGCIIVFHDSEAWHENPALRRLLSASERVWPNTAIHAGDFESHRLVVFRYHRVR